MEANRSSRPQDTLKTHIKSRFHAATVKVVPASLVVLGFVGVSLLGRAVADWMIGLQARSQVGSELLGSRATDERLESQARWLSDATESSLKRALQDAQDVAVSDGKHLPRMPGLIGVAILRGAQVQFHWNESMRSRIQSARVDSIDSMRKELLLAMSQTQSLAQGSEIEVLPMSTPPLSTPLSLKAETEAHATRWLALSVSRMGSSSSQSPTATPSSTAGGGAGDRELQVARVVALFDPAQGVKEISDTRARSVGGRFRFRLIEAESLAVLASSDELDFSARFRMTEVSRGMTGASVQKQLSSAGWIPGQELRGVLRDFISLGRVSALGTYDQNRVRIQRVSGFPLVIVAEAGAPRTPAVGSSAVGTTAGKVANSTFGIASLFLFAGVMLVCGAFILLYRKVREGLLARSLGGGRFEELLKGSPLTSMSAQPQFISAAQPQVMSAAQPQVTLSSHSNAGNAAATANDALSEILNPTEMGEGAEVAGAPVFSFQGHPSLSKGEHSSAPPPSANLSSVAAASPPLEQLRREKEHLEKENQALKKTCEQLERALISARRNVDILQEQDRLLAEFETGSLIQRRPRLIADQAVKTANLLCGTPALFFMLEPKRGTAVLTSESGLKETGISPPAVLEFALSAAAESEIGKITQEGSIASLSAYEPLAQLMLKTFGVSHFEAWAVTGYSWLGRAAAKPKVLGVLVLLQSGSRTLTLQRSLGRMLRNAGLVYENSLLSQ